MPVLSAFFGMIVRMFHVDHAPAHVHVQYGEYEIVVRVSNGAVLAGKIPPRLLKLLRTWMGQHREELLHAWEQAQAFKMPKKIKPLE